MARILAESGVAVVDGTALDLGVSSMQLDDADRGFSFRNDGPLDMRQEQYGRSAADVVNEVEESVLADIIYQYGEERQARRIARAIVAARAEGPLTRTMELAEIVRNTYRGGLTTKPTRRQRLSRPSAFTSTTNLASLSEASKPPKSCWRRVGDWPSFPSIPWKTGSLKSSCVPIQTVSRQALGICPLPIQA